MNNENEEDYVDEEKQPEGGWLMQGIWNETLAANTRAVERRDHIWSSEIGKNHYERYLKMSGKPYDTPFPARVLRKFSAGNFFEQLIGQVLKEVGVLKSSQERITFEENEDHLRITGKIDYIAGGFTDWGQARTNVINAGFDDFVLSVSLKLIDFFEANHKNGLEEILLEIKSVNSQVFWAKKDYLTEAYPHHVMQLYTYLKQKNHKKGLIVYISKDDLTIQECPVLYPTAYLEDKWNDDVKKMSEYWRKQEEPPKPDNVVFDKRKKLRFQHEKVKHEIKGIYVPNWEVEWSPYFKEITGVDTVEEWEKSIADEIKSKNEELKDAYKLTLLENGNISNVPQKKLPINTQE